MLCRSNVVHVVSTASAFAALREDGSVFTWGGSQSGGNSSAVASQLDGTIDVVQVFSNDGAFAALRADGSVVNWGITSTPYGVSSSDVASQLSSGVVAISNIEDNTNVVFSPSVANDVTPPVFASATVNGSTLILTYTDDNLLKINTLPIDAFSVVDNNINTFYSFSFCIGCTLTAPMQF